MHSRIFISFGNSFVWFSLFFAIKHGIQLCVCVRVFFSLMKIFIEIYGKKAEKSSGSKKMVHGQKDERKVLNNANLVNCLSKWWACVHKTHMRCRHTMRFHRSHHDKIKAQMRFIQVHCECVYGDAIRCAILFVHINFPCFDIFFLLLFFTLQR